MTALGVNAPWAVAFQAAVGKTVRWCRTYGQTQAWSPSSGGFADTIAADARGQYSILSFKSTFTWAQVASGSDDARLTAIANGLVSNGVLPGIIVFNHEPENDAGTAADFKAASGHVKTVMAPLMPGWRFGVCLMVDTFRTGSGRHPDDWVHTSNDVLLVDGYNWRDADTFGGGWADPAVSDRTPASIFGVNINAADYAEALGMAFGFGEIGCSREQADTTGVERTAWWNLFADYILALPPGKVEMICHFEKNTSAVTPGDGGLVNWAIRSEPASAIAFGRPLATSGNGWGDGPWGTMHWGGDRSGATYIDVNTVLPAGTTTWTDERVVTYGRKLSFSPASTATLVMDNKNLIVYGELEMRPASASVIQTVRFINVNEQTYVGAPPPVGAQFLGDTAWSKPGANMGSMTPSTTDIGLWVMETGILDAIGTPRVGWNRTGTDPTWLSTDDVRTVPFRSGNYVTFNDHYRNGVLGFYNKFDPATDTLQSVDPGNGVTYTQEAFNLTRNVLFEGTVGKRAHVLIMTPDVTQVLKYCRFENMGPRKILANGETADIRGRWAGVHFHHLMNSVGTLAEGVVVVNGTGHAYVSHDSHNVTFRDCIAYHTVNDAYWWDDERVLNGTQIPPTSNSGYSVAPDQLSRNVLYDHCMATWTYMPPGEGTSSLNGFTLQGTTGNRVINSVAVGNQGTSSASGFAWPEAAGGIWLNSNNVSHNNAGRGVYIWQNTSVNHELFGMVCFRNGIGGITNGAYDNNYHHNDSVCFQNNGSGDVSTDFIDAAAGNLFVAPNYRQVIQDSWFGDFGIIHHVVNTPGAKVIIRNNHLGSLRINEQRDNQGPTGQFRHGDFDFIENDIEEPEEFCNQSVHPHAGSHTCIYMYNKSTNVDLLPSIFRVQRADGTAFRMQQVGLSTSEWDAVTIAPFGFSILPQTLTSATQGIAYSETIDYQIGSGIGPVTFGLRPGSGPLPPGISLSSAGALTGIPTTPGTYNPTIQAVDLATQRARRTLPILVGSSASLQVVTTTLPGGVRGDPYSQPVSASGGFPPYTWSIVAGSLPPGLTLSTLGTVSGTPTTGGSYSATFRVTDSAVATAQRLIDINVLDLSPVFTTAFLSPGELTEPYQRTLLASGGVPPYTFAVETGPLPPGISMNTLGAFSGTPTVVGDYPLRLRVTDSSSHGASQDFVMSIYEELQMEIPSFPEASVGQLYGATVIATGGAPPLSFTGSDGDSPPSGFPPGLTMASDGSILGTPTVEGAFAFNIVVTDAIGVAVMQPSAITVLEQQAADEESRELLMSFALRRPHGGSRLRDRV